MVGSATLKEPDGTCVTCEMAFSIELHPGPRSSPGVLEYDGVHGGHLTRTILDASGAGISLHPDVHAPMLVRSIAPGAVQILIPINATADGRFYRALSDLRGTVGADGNATGTWNCAPFDIYSGGYVDTSHIAAGTWTLTPIP